MPTISLRKGEKADVVKSKILVGLGWDQNRYDGEQAFDLDVSVFLLDEKGKVTNPMEDFIFYNNPQTPNGSVVHSGDNVTGMGDGDDEQIRIKLNELPVHVQKIAFVITIHEAKQRGQNFGQVSNSFIRIVDEDSQKELIRYDLGEDFSTQTALLAGELYRYKGAWKFWARGTGYEAGLDQFTRDYGLEERCRERGIEFEALPGSVAPSPSAPQVAPSAGERQPVRPFAPSIPSRAPQGGIYPLR